jgi:ADP-ribose pyrophosphatase
MERAKIPSYLNENSLIFKGKRLALYHPEFTSQNGKIYRREIVVHPGAVVILPFLDENTVLLIKNYRASIDEHLFELPAGLLEKGESPDTTAHRELREETGYLAKSMKKVLEFYSTPGFTNELLHAYVAKDLTFMGQKLEETEHIEVFPTRYSDALEMIRSGKLIDAKSILLLLYLKTL